MNRFPRLGSAIAVLLALLLYPPHTAAQQGWASAPSTILSGDGGPGDVAWPSIAFDSAGNAIAVWTRFGESTAVVRTARFTKATNSWSTPIVISTPGEFCAAASVGLDASGNAVVTWNRISEGQYFVEAARYTASTGTWSAAFDIGGGAHLASIPHLAINADGDVVVVWARAVVVADEITSLSVHAARYSADTATWAGVDDLSAPAQLAYFPRVGIDPVGNAIAVWKRSVGTNEIIQAARSGAGGGWSAPVDISPGGAETDYPAEIAIEPAGNAVVVWNHQGTIVSARYTATTTSWSLPVLVSGGNADSWPSIALDPVGNAVAVWTEDQIVHAARLPTQSDSWGAKVPLSPVTEYTRWAPQPVVVDHAGNAVVAWRWVLPTHSLVQSARYTAATNTWDTGTQLSAAGGRYDDNGVALAVDPGGSVAALWFQVDGTSLSIQSRRWEAAPGPFNITDVETSTGTLALRFESPQTNDPAFAPVNYEYSLDDGASWTTRTPASTVQPLVIGGLTPNALYTVQLRAVNLAGAGAPSPAVVVVAGPGPSPPTRLTATAIAGNRVTIVWTPPPRGNYPPLGYVLEGGILPGQVLASIPTGSSAPTFTFTAPSGAFYVRVHTLSPGIFGGPLRSIASNEIRIFVNVPAAPSAPAHLLGQVSASALALSWTNTFGGGAPTAMQLHVTGAITGVLPLPLGEMFAFPAVPPGTYTMRVAAVNANGVSPLSNPVTLTFPSPCTGTPGVPTFVTATRNGNRITVTWSPPESGAAVTGYWLQVSGSFVGAFPTTARSLAGSVGPGTYAFSVFASNACRAGPPSAPQTVTVP